MELPENHKIRVNAFHRDGLYKAAVAAAIEEDIGSTVGADEGTPCSPVRKI